MTDLGKINPNLGKTAQKEFEARVAAVRAAHLGRSPFLTVCDGNYLCGICKAPITATAEGWEHA